MFCGECLIQHVNIINYPNRKHKKSDFMLYHHANHITTPPSFKLKLFNFPLISTLYKTTFHIFIILT